MFARKTPATVALFRSSLLLGIVLIVIGVLLGGLNVF
jgi:hypothetical protein